MTRVGSDEPAIRDEPVSPQRPRPARADPGRSADPVRQPRQDLQGRRPRGRRAAGPRPARRTGRDDRDRRRVGQRQVDAAEHPRRPRRPVGRARRRSPATSWPRWARASGPATGARSSGSSGSRPRATCCRTCRRVENVELPMILDGRRTDDRARARRELLDLVGLPDRADHRPGRLVRRRAAAGRDRGRAGQRARGRSSPTSRPASSTRHRARGVRAAAPASTRSSARRSSIVTHDPLVSEQVQPDGRHPRRADLDGDAAPAELGEDGDHRSIAEEFAVLDRAGRLQLPREHVEALELEHRVRLRLEEDHIGVWPDGAGRERARAERDGDEPRDRRRRARRSALGADGPVVEAVDLVRDFPSATRSSMPCAAINLRVAPGELIAVRGRSAPARRRCSTCSAASTGRRAAASSVDGVEVSAMAEASWSTSGAGRSGSSSRRSGWCRSCRGRERRGAAAARRTPTARQREARVARAARARRARRPRRATGRTSCRAASSSGSRSPGRSPTARSSCSPTSRPASSTRTPGTRSWLLLRSIVRHEGITAVVATHDPAAASTWPTASSSCATGR